MAAGDTATKNLEKRESSAENKIAFVYGDEVDGEPRELPEDGDDCFIRSIQSSSHEGGLPSVSDQGPAGRTI